MHRDRTDSDPQSRPRRPASAVADKLRRALDVRTLTQHEVDHVLAELRRKAQRRHSDDQR